jgi:hypothetical protein
MLLVIAGMAGAFHHAQLFFLWDGVLHTFCPDLPGTAILPVSAFHVARMTSACHCTQLLVWQSLMNFSVWAGLEPQSFWSQPLKKVVLYLMVYLHHSAQSLPLMNLTNYYRVNEWIYNNVQGPGFQQFLNSIFSFLFLASEPRYFMPFCRLYIVSPFPNSMLW